MYTFEDNTRNQQWSFEPQEEAALEEVPRNEADESMRNTVRGSWLGRRLGLGGGGNESATVNSRDPAHSREPARSREPTFSEPVQSNEHTLQRNSDASLGISDTGMRSTVATSVATSVVTREGSRETPPPLPLPVESPQPSRDAAGVMSMISSRDPDAASRLQSRSREASRDPETRTSSPKVMQQPWGPTALSQAFPGSRAGPETMPLNREMPSSTVEFTPGGVGLQQGPKTTQQTIRLGEQPSNVHSMYGRAAVSRPWSDEDDIGETQLHNHGGTAAGSSEGRHHATSPNVTDAPLSAKHSPRLMESGSIESNKGLAGTVPPHVVSKTGVRQTPEVPTDDRVHDESEEATSQSGRARFAWRARAPRLKLKQPPLASWLRRGKVEEEQPTPGIETEGVEQETHGAAGDAAEGPDVPMYRRLLVTTVRKGPAARPCCCASVGALIALAITVVGVVLAPPTVNDDFGSFLKTDVNTSTMRDTYLAALAMRPESSGRRLQESPSLYQNFDIAIMYEMREGQGNAAGLFNSEILTQIAKFEQSLRGLPVWAELCNKAEERERVFCTTGLSFVSYALPTLTKNSNSIVPSALKFDGKGRDDVPLETSLRITQDLKIDKILLPTVFKVTDRSSNMLRSVFRFKLFCCMQDDPVAERRAKVAQLDKFWQDFAITTLLPRLQEAASGIIGGEQQTKNDWPLYVFYTGTQLDGLEVLQALERDRNLALGSVTFVLLYMIWHTRSIVLALWGLLAVLLSVPLSYVFYYILAGSSTMSIASFLSLFLIVGLGSDVVFVYADFWQESRRFSETIHGRLIWLYWHAGKASFATTATTAISFFANLASVLKPLRQFGFFMGLCVMLVWVLLTLVFVPMCVVDELYCSRCRLRCFEKPAGQPGRMDAAWDWLLKGLKRWRCWILLGVALLTAVAFSWAVGVHQVDTDLPNIFPTDHNQNRGKEVARAFHPLTQVFKPFHEPSPEKTQVCKDYDVTNNECSLYWCEVKTGSGWPPAVATAEGLCQCSHIDTPCGNTPPTLVTRFVGGPKELSDDDLRGNVGTYIADRAAASSLQFQTPGNRLESMTKSKVKGPLVLQEWETGDVKLRTMTELSSFMTRQGSSCGWREVCYCGTYECKLPSNWTRGQQVQLFNSAARLLQQEQQWRVPVNDRANIDVVFGLDVIAGASLLAELDPLEAWRFNSNHDMSQPWAQRNLYDFCSNLPAELRVTAKTCWIEDFKKFVKDDKQNKFKFPLLASQFNEQAMKFAKTALIGFKSANEFFWVRDGKVKASFMMFTVDVSVKTSPNAALEYMGKWDAYVAQWNSQAKEYSKVAWHTSSLWVRAEAQNALVSSTVVTILIVMLLAFMGMGVFTRSCILSLLVVTTTVSVVIWLFWFIVAVMTWKIGPIEVIALIVFIGYAVTYSLHIAHRYGCHGALEMEPIAGENLLDKQAVRQERVRFAFKTIGCSMLGSATTTLGCSIFLLFCTLTIFQKLGGVVLSVTLISIIMSLLVLPAALLRVGPLNPGQCGRPTDCLAGIEELQTRMAAQLSAFKLPRDSTDSSVKGEHEVACETDGTGPSEPTGSSAQHSQPSASPVPPGNFGKAAASDGGAQDAHSRVPAQLTRSRIAQAGVTGVSLVAQQPARPHTRPTAGRSPDPNKDSTGGPAASTSDRRKRLSEMEFDIGTESPLDRIWAREGRSQTPPPAGSTGSRPAELTGDGDTVGSSSRHAGPQHRSGGAAL